MALHQLRRIVRFPLRLVRLAEVACERFLAPGRLRGVGDGGEGGGRLVSGGVFKELQQARKSQRALA